MTIAEVDLLQVAGLVIQALTLLGVFWVLGRLGILLFGARGSNGSTYWRFKVENGTPDRTAKARFRLVGNNSAGAMHPTYHLPAQVEPPAASPNDVRYELAGILPMTSQQFPEYEPSGMSSVVGAVLTLQLDDGKKAVDIPISAGGDTLAVIDVKITRAGVNPNYTYSADITRLVHVGDEGELRAYNVMNFPLVP